MNSLSPKSLRTLGFRLKQLSQINPTYVGWKPFACRLISLLLIYALVLQLAPRAVIAAPNLPNPVAKKIRHSTNGSPLSSVLAKVTEGVESLWGTEPATSEDPPADTLTDAVISRSRPNISGGRIEGALRVFQGGSFSLGGSTQITGDIFLAGSPSIQLNGGAQHGGIIIDGGAATPANYSLTLSGGITLPGKIHTHVDSVALPVDFPASVPVAGGSRSVTVNSQSDIAAIGDWQTIRDLNVTGSRLTIDVPPGNYRTFTVNGNSRLNFAAGTYNFANTFHLDGSATVQATGLVNINVAQNLTVNSGAVALGSYTSPANVRLNVLGSNLTINGSSQVSGMVRAYNGTVTLNGTSQIRGQVIANIFTLNGGKVIGAVWPAQSGNSITTFGPRRFDRTTGQANQYLEQFALPAGVTSPFSLHIQNGASGGSNRVSSATIKLNGTEILIQNDLNQNVATIDRTVSLDSTNTLEVRLTSDPGSYLIINIIGASAIDTTAPILSIAEPSNNLTTTTATINVSGSASDAGTPSSGVAHVYVNGVEATFNPANSTWSISDVPLVMDTNQITVRALDGAGNETTATLTVIREAPNQAPTVNAGADQTFALPQTASLHGTASDDGLPTGSSLSTSWSVVSNPGSVNFTNADSLDTNASFGTSGTYVLRLTATDGDLSTSDDITLTVQPENQPPTVNPGADQTIALPRTATLNGTVTDDGWPQGSILSTLWTQVSGPGTTTFEDPLLTETVASFSAAGTYVVRLTASDGELSSSNDVTVTVHPENQAPTVNAGPDQTISLPDVAQLNGSAADDGWPFGSTLSVTWSAVSGPGPVSFGNPNVSVTAASFTIPGTYLLRLTASDSELSTSDDLIVTVTPPNQAPSVTAGSDQTITLPAAANLNGTVTDDGLPLGSSVSASWTKVSGPGEVSFADANQPVTTAQFSAPGNYVLLLTASDGALTGSDDVTITVIPENHAPTVNAGADQTITLPNTASLNGSVSDDGLPSGSTLTTTWSKLSGPGDVTFASPNTTVTSAAFSVSGTYVLRLTASDSELTTSDDLQVVVIPQNFAPTVSAGADQTITLPNTASLNGSVSDDGLPSGSTLTTTWSKLSGPGNVTFASPNTTVTTAAFSVSGTYVLRLTASDSELTTTDDLQVVVIPQNFAPTVSAGADQTITLPNTASLNGNVTDDGLPSGSTLTTTWSKLSGPGNVTFASPNTTATTAAFSVSGTYVLRLTANDSELTTTDDLQVVVIPQNFPPTVNAGADQTITFPASASLNGSVSDDGLPAGSNVTTAWSKVSGPGTVTFGNPAVTVTTASFDQPGIYVLRLTASDSEHTTSDDLTITVVDPRVPPTANFVVPESTGTAGAFVIAQSQFSGSAFAANQLLDDSNFTFWNMQGITGHFAKFQFFDQQNIFIDRVRMQSNQGSIGPTNLKDFDVLVSSTTSDDASFVLVLSATMLNNGQLQEFVFPGGPVRARYIKLVAKNNYGSTGFISLATFNPVALGHVDSLISLPGIANVARSQSPVQILNGGAIHSASYGTGLNNADGLLGYNRGGFITSSLSNQFAIIQLGGDELHTIKGVRLATWYDIGFGSPTAVKDFEVWVSTTTPDHASFTKVLTATTQFIGNLQTFIFPGGPVPARYVKYVPLNTHGTGAVINTAAFDVLMDSGARVIAASHESPNSPSPPEAAFDGDANTSWSSGQNNVTNVWVKTALRDDKVQKVFGFRINPSNSLSLFQGPKDFEIRVSTTTSDDSAFTTVHTGTLPSTFTATGHEILLSNLIDAKYVQFFWKNGYSTSVIGVKELEVFAAPDRGSAIMGYSQTGTFHGANTPEVALDLDPTNQPWTTPLNQTADVSFKMVLPRAELWTINHVAFRPAIASNGNYRAPSNFLLQVSTTDAADASFTTVLAGTLVNSTQLQDLYFTPVQARYVRVVLLKGGDGSSLALHSFMVYSANTIGTTTRFFDQSTDTDGQVVSWAWSFGDGGTSNEKNPTHTFAQAGDYTVTLTVTDNTGLSHSFSNVYHVVDSIKPDFSISPMIAHEGGESVRFSDLQELMLLSTALRTYNWGDGTALHTQYNKNILKTYNDSGVYQVTLRVGDSLGLAHTVTKNITVLNMNPTVDIPAGKTVFWGENWTSVPTINDQSPVDKLSLTGEWVFGDGQTSQCVNCTNANATVTHAYSLPGTYTVTLTIRDKDGGVASDSAVYNVIKRTTAVTFVTTQPQGNGDTYLVRAKLMDTFGNLPLAGKSLNFVLNGVMANAVTDSSGVAEVNFSFAPGAFVGHGAATFVEDAMYQGSSAVFGDPLPPITPSTGVSNKGKDFWVVTLDNFLAAFGSVNVNFFITSNVATTGVITQQSEQPKNFSVAANGVTQVPPGLTNYLFNSDMIENKGVHVVSQQPITLMELNNFSHTTDAYLALPTEALGTEYIVLGHANGSNLQGTHFGIVAPNNGTNVTITPTITTGTRLAGVPFTITLNQGQTYYLRNDIPGKQNDFTGTLISSTKPIAVFGGHKAGSVPDSVLFATHLVEQLTPVNTWGKHFVTMPYKSRNNGDSFRFLASEDNTSVYLNGQRVALLNRAQFHERIVNGPAYIISDKPILVAQYSNGAHWDGGTGDPSMALIPPYEQYMNDYVVASPTFGVSQFINVIAPTSAIGSVILDGTAIPASSFVPISNSGFSGAQMTVAWGVHKLTGPTGFGVSVYGFGIDDAYSFPGGMSLLPTVTTGGLTLTPNNASATIGTQQCINASLKDQFGVPLGAQTINFSVTGVNPSSSSATTNAGGQANLCYVGANTGTDTITATAGTAQATATIIWTPPNQPPVVNAGADQTATVNQTVNISGSGTDDGLPANMLSFLWTKESGPGNVVFGNAVQPSTTAVFDTPGVYVLRLTASDTLLTASDDLEVIVTAIPDHRDNQGKEFWIGFPRNGGGTPQLFLFITAESAASGTVNIPGQNFTANFNVTGGSSTTVEIPVGVEAFTSDRVENKGIHVTATSNVSVYALSQRNDASDAYTALPSDALGTEYVLLGYTNTSNLRNSFLLAVAPEDGTILTVTPPMDMTQFNNQVAGGYFYTRKAGVPYNVALNKGQTFLLYNIDPAPGDISGTTVSSNKPVAVLGGHSCAFVPSANAACNHLIEQLTPVDSWGKSFVTMPLATRTGLDRYRFAAATNNTHVSVNGVQVATLNRGQFHEQLLNGPGTITSDKAILVVQYSNGLQFDNSNGDPFMMLNVPPEQFVKSYVLKTPEVNFSQHFINVIVPTANVGSVMLDGGALSPGSFVPIGSSGYSGAQVPVTQGTHTLSGPVAFGAYMYGYDAFDAYGFPGGMLVNSMNLSGRVTLTPLTGTSLTGMQHCVTATVRDANNLAAPNTLVEFNVAGANPTSSSAQTDAAGLATFCYTGTVAGQDTITAATGGTMDTATRSWTTANQPPVVNAGPDQTTFVGVKITLNGSATDDGLPVEFPLTVRWSVVSGPGIVDFEGGDRVAVTKVSFRSAGTYILRFTANDSVFSTSDDLVVTVPVTPPNQTPTANAGPDLSASIFGSIVTNGGNDQPLVSGEIPGWIEVQGSGWTQANSATAAGFPEPQRGSSYFFANDTQQAELTQDVDVRAFAANIAAGTQQFEFKTYVRSAAETVPDAARVILEYRNAGNNAVVATLDSGVITSTTGWHLTEDLRTVPAGTGWIRIRLLATLNTGPTNDAFFDTITLRPVGGAAVKLNGVATDDGLPPPGTLTTTWTKISGPGTVSFADANAAVSGAAFTTPGTYVLRLTVRDLQLFTAIDDVTVTVHPANQPPVVNAGANQTITLPANANLVGTVNDDGQPPGSSVSISWSKASGPGTVTFGNANALSTTASFSTAGTYILRLTADDSEYGASSDVTITVNPAPVNQPPTVNPGPNQTIQLPVDTVTLNGVVTDDGLPAGSTLSISWTKTSGPGAVTFGNANSATTTAQFGAAGSYVLRLTASDGPFTVFAEVGVLVNPANQAPTANAGADQTTPLSQAVQLDGSATDDGLPNGNVTTLWSKVSGPGTVTFINPNHSITGANFSEVGTYVLRLTASDGALTGFDEVTITVIEDVPPPTVQITAPADEASITEPTPVTGSVSGGDWKLEYSLGSDDNQNNRVWTQFASGTGAATGTLGTLDPTMMMNGLFDIRLSATDQHGQTSFTRVSVIIEGNVKIGNFTLSFIDLSIPVAGLPMEVIRTYDSRDKRVGDFGFGWTMGLKNIRVEKSGVLGLRWFQTASNEVFPNYCMEPTGSHLVTVTFPGGKVFKFQASITPQCQRFAPISTANLSFTPMAGTVGKLEVMGSSEVLIAGSVPGPVQLINQNGGVDIFNSFVFKFTAEDGTAYVIDQRTGLQSIADSSGNTVTIGAGGITHSSGKSIVFNRDASGRIASIVDPNGNSQFYNYDTNGDLVSYTDNENNTSTYTYDANHRLLTIQDPRGIQPIRNEYDADGRLISHTDGFGKVITFVHDLATRVETVTDRMGHPTVFEYDERGNILRKTDARGGVTTFTYDANDNVLTETNALNKTTTYTYDANNHRTSITDPVGNVTEFTYNAQGKVLTTKDPRGKITTNTFNPAGKILTTEDALHNVTTFTYSVFDGQQTSMKDALNQITRYDYTGNYLTKETDALGRETTYTYDSNGNRASQSVKRTNAQGQLETITTTYEYDKMNRLTKTTFADSTFIQVEYDSIGKQIATVDQLGRRTEFTYDDMGRLTKTTYPDGKFEEATYDAEGRRLTAKDRAGHVTTYTYDELGRLTKTTFEDGTFTETSYDAVGRVLTTTDARGNVTRYFYDDAGRRTKIKNALNQETTFVYDANGNQLSMTDALTHTISYEYDDNNQRTKTTYEDDTFESVAYDALGRTLSRTDQAGKLTQYTHDALGRLTKVKDVLNQETTYSYDELGQQISQTDANNHTTRFEYDQLGRRVKRILPGGQFETYAYDNVGNLSNKTDFNGKTTTFTYDTMRRLLTKVPDASLAQPTITFTYNATGHRATMNDASGTTVYSYDLRNRLTSKQTPFGTLTYTYNDAGNLATTRSSNANGVSVDYGYDALNRLSSVKDNRLVALNGGVTNYTYDDVGNLHSYQYPNGVTTSYAYNTLNRLTTVTIGTSTIGLASYSYTLGPAGNRTQVTEASGRTVTYNYDDLYRLTGETIANDSQAVNGSIGYVYDPVGNRLQRTSTVAPISAQNLSYDVNNRVTTDGHDNNGNTISSNGASYDYDFENHLASANGGTVRYVYDGDGNRVSKIVGGITTEYLVDTNNPTGRSQVLDELVNDEVVRSYTFGTMLISQRQLLNNLWSVSFYGSDAQLSVRLLTDAAGSVTDTYTYDAFGNLIASTGNTPNEHLYTGERFDANIGFYHLRSRDMRPDVGRFLTMDSFEGDDLDPVSLHKYLYANANPVNLMDPDGYLSTPAIGMFVHAYLKRDFMSRSAPGLRDGNIAITTILRRRGVSAGRWHFPGYLLRPDLVEFGVDSGSGLRSVYEIKPILGKTIGIVKMYAYMGLLNAYDPGWGPGTAVNYTPPSTFPFLHLTITTFPPDPQGVILYDTNLLQYMIATALVAALISMAMAMVEAVAVVTASRGRAFA